jgi:hypothetical protein
MSVCVAARVGVREHLETLPGLVLSGGVTTADGYGDRELSACWRLSMVTLRWEPMPSLARARYGHTCCTVRGNLVALGGARRWEGEAKTWAYSPHTCDFRTNILPVCKRQRLVI